MHVRYVNNSDQFDPIFNIEWLLHPIDSDVGQEEAGRKAN